MTHDLCPRSPIPTPFPTPSLILLMPQICACLHRQPASIPPPPPNPHAGPGADFWTHLHELVLSLLPLAQPLGLLLHFSLGSAAHQDCVRVQTRTRGQLTRNASGSQMGCPRTTTPQSQSPRSASTYHGAGGAEPRVSPTDPPFSHCPTPPQRAPGSCQGTSDLHYILYLMSASPYFPHPPFGLNISV